MSKAGFTFDGVDPGDSAKGNIILIDKRIQLVPGPRDRVVVAGPRPGVWDFGTELGDRRIELDVVSGDNTNEAGNDTQMRALADLFDPTNDVAGDKASKQLIFDTEPDKYWLAKLIDGPLPEYLPSAGKLRLTMRCSDPFAYSTAQYVVQGGAVTLSGFSAYRQIPEKIGWNLVKNAAPSDSTGYVDASGVWSVVTDSRFPSGKAHRLIATALYQQRTVDIDIEPGRPYSFGIWIASDDVAAMGVEIWWVDAAGTATWLAATPQVTSSVATEVFVTNFTTPGNARKLKIRMLTFSASGIGFFSSMRLKQQTTQVAAWAASDQQTLGNRGLVIYEATTNKVPNGDAESALSGSRYGLVERLSTLNAWRDGSGFGGFPAGGFALAANVASGVANASRAMIVGSPDWDDAAPGSAWRWLWRTGGVFYLAIRGTNLQNSSAETSLRIKADGTNIEIGKMVNGTFTVLVTVAAALMDNTWYWWDWTASGTTITAKLFADSPAGSKSATQVGSTASATDAALTFKGEMCIGLTSGANPLQFGGVTTSPTAPVLVAIPTDNLGQSPAAGVASDAGPGAFAVSSVSKFSGTRSYAITSTPVGNTNAFFATGTGTSAVPVSASTPYYASARVKVPALTGGGTVVLRAIQIKSDGSLTAANPDIYIAGASTSGTGDWQVIGGVFTTEADCAFVELRPQLNTVAQRVTCYFDNIGLEQKTYGTLNSGDGQEHTTTTRAASSTAADLPAGFDWTQGFAMAGTMRFDHAYNGMPNGHTRYLFDLFLDASNHVEFWIYPANGAFGFKKIRQGIAVQITDEVGPPQTLPAAGDTIGWGILFLPGAGIYLVLSKNGGVQATYSLASAEAQLGTFAAGTPTLYLGRYGGGSGFEADGTLGIKRIWSTVDSTTLAKLQAIVVGTAIYAQQDEAYESVVYRFDGAAVPENYASGTLHVDVGGTYWTYPVVEITAGAGYVGNVTLTDAGGNVLTWNGTLALNDVLKIDTSSYRVYLNGVLAMSGVAVGSKWPVLLPNQRNDLAVGGIAAANVKALKATFRNRWI